jgi:hypothetical protein
MLRELSFVLGVFGVVFLLFYLQFSSFVEIESIGDLDGLEINSKVVLRGFVEDVRVFEKFVIFKIEGIELVCDCENGYLGKELEVEGVVEDYLNGRQVRVLRVVVLD